MMAKLTIKRSLDDMKDKNVNGHLKFENVLANQELPAEVRDQIRLKGISCKVNVNKLLLLFENLFAPTVNKSRILAPVALDIKTSKRNYNGFC